MNGADTVIPFNSGVGNFTSNNFSIRRDYYHYDSSPAWTQITGYITFNEATKQVTVNITGITTDTGHGGGASQTIGIVEQ